MKRTGLARRTPLKRVSATAKRRGKTCSRLRCQRPPARGLDLCLSHAKREADRLFSLAVRRRDKACVRCGKTYELQAAHILSRSYHAIRFDFDNCVTLCRSDHVYFTHRPLEWEAWVDDRHPGLRMELRDKALTYSRPDYRAILEVLRHAAAKS